MFSIAAVSIMTFGIMILNMALKIDIEHNEIWYKESQHNDTRHNNTSIGSDISIESLKRKT